MTEFNQKVAEYAKMLDGISYPQMGYLHYTTLKGKKQQRRLKLPKNTGGKK